MSVLEIIIMSVFTVVAIKYLVDMIKYAKGYQINGKCRYGKEYAEKVMENDIKRKEEFERMFWGDACPDMH